MAKAQAPDGPMDWELFEQERKRELEKGHQELLSDARAVFRAMDGWGTVNSKKEWEKTVK